MQTTRKIAARVSGPTTVCGRTISFSSLGVSILAISIHNDSHLSEYFSIGGSECVAAADKISGSVRRTLRLMACDDGPLGGNLKCEHRRLSFAGCPLAAIA